MLKISAAALQKMIQHCQQDYPNEACGYLAGTGNLAIKTVPIANLHASPSSYEMDPKEQLAATKELRAEGLSHLAIYHSHVATEAYPSRRDVTQAAAVQDFFDGYYVLVTLKEEKHPHARAFKVQDGGVLEEPLEVAG